MKVRGSYVENIAKNDPGRVNRKSGCLGGIGSQCS